MKNDLPSGWRHERLGDLVDKDRRITYGIVQPGPRLSVGVRMIRGKDYSSGKVDDRDLYCVAPEISAPYQRSVVQGGDILLSIVGYLGQVAVVPEHLAGANITQTTARIAIAPPNLGAFFFQQLQGPTFRKQIERYKKGSAQPGLNLADVEKMEVVVPPLAEQRKIAAILSSVDETIEKTEAVIAQLDVVKKAMLEELLVRGIPGRHSRFKQTEIGEVPDAWRIVSIEDLADRSQNSLTIGPFGSALLTSDYSSEGAPVVFVRDVRPNRFAWKSRVFVSAQKAEELNAHRVDPGDVVITKMGLPAGVAAIYPGDMSPGVVTADIIRLRVSTDAAHPGFVSYALNSRRTATQVAGITAGQTRPKLTLRDYRTLKIALPPKPEQIQIAGVLASVDECTARNEAVLACSTELKRSIAHVLLSGELRVVGGGSEQ